MSDILGWIIGLVLAGLFGFLIYIIWLSIQAALFPKAAPISEERKRELEFKSNMDERQHQLNAQLRGASMVEVWMTFEARLYALEQRVIAAEQRNQDDGK